MYGKVLLVFLMRFCQALKIIDDPQIIQVFDMTHATTWRDMTDYYDARERGWKICYNCGVFGLGTSMHMDYSETKGSTQLAVIPSEYLLTRLAIIDVTPLTEKEPTLSLTLKAANQWAAVRQDHSEPTILLFKFGWTEKNDFNRRSKCSCQVPGISYELAQWIAANLSHVVGVGTDAPTLESEETRDHSSRTVTNLLARNGIYMIENANLRRKIPESGCMAIAMPLKMLSASYVPTRLTAFCAPRGSEQVMLAQRPSRAQGRGPHGRDDDLNLDDIFSIK